MVAQNLIKVFYLTFNWITVRNYDFSTAMSKKWPRRVTYQELKNHSAYSDAWISINGTVYDITHFIERHPFGDTFRGHLGTECGGLFSSAHTNTSVEKEIKKDYFLKLNKIEIVGYLDVSNDHLHEGNDRPFLDRIVYKNTEQDLFWKDIQTNVASYLKKHHEKTHYTAYEGILFILYYLTIQIFLCYWTWVRGSLLAAMMLGLHEICMLANISHMATHSGFTDSPLLDFIAMHLFDLCGMSGLEWQITHQTHHNQPHSSIDHQTNAYPYIGVRIHNYMKYRLHHRYQYIYFWVTVSSYIIIKTIMTTPWIFIYKEFSRNKYDIVAHIMAKGILLFQILYCFYVHSFWLALSVFAVHSVSYSQVAFGLLFNDHEENHKVLSDVDDVSCYQERLSWAEVQVRTSGNWYPTNWFLAFIEFHYGYFNYHIEHHLFPTFKPRLLKKISPIVRNVCTKHGISYISTSFLDVQRSLQGHLYKMSQKHQVNPEASTQ